jgi:hypothetical protein
MNILINNILNLKLLTYVEYDKEYIFNFKFLV